ncbi:MAG: zf-HC2 domain-containing protein [Acidobacteria bacterium]|nr:zf-HC2 domain-containing protein [Acidobacteriota bacterium]
MTGSKAKQLNCQEALRKVFDFVDGALEGVSLVEMRTHLATCRHCFDRAEFERLLKARMARLKANPASGELRARVQSLIEGG